MTSDGETTNIKVVDLEKIWNFIVDNFFIWICLEFETINHYKNCMVFGRI